MAYPSPQVLGTLQAWKYGSTAPRDFFGTRKKKRMHRIIIGEMGDKGGKQVCLTHLWILKIVEGREIAREKRRKI